MNAAALIDRLEWFAMVLPVVVHGLPEDDVRWRPQGGAWSILEIVMHLADEEEADFGARLKSLLEDPAAPWPPIDPEGWAVERKYNDGKLDEAIGRFVTRRRDWVMWLRDRKTPAWTAAYKHEKGDIRAGELLASWAAHDALHLRQIAKRLHQIAGRDGGEFPTGYAGPWGA